MIIKSLTIRQGMYSKKFCFSSGVTLISSNGANSVGKTTLLRTILYALGESVSGTQGFDLKKIETKLTLISDGGNTLKLFRNNRVMRVQSNGEEARYTLPYDLQFIKTLVYEIDNVDLLDNLLGAFYIDQDKGWTLLNRGIVICRIRFSIEPFVQGLAGKDYFAIHSKIKQLSKDIDKYSFIEKAAGYKNNLVENPGFEEISIDLSRDNDRLNQLRIQKASLIKRISSLRRAQKDNKRFIKFVSEMGLRVRTDDGEEIRVSSDNLVGYKDEERYFDAEILTLLSQQSLIQNSIDEIEASLGINEKLFNVDSLAKEFDRQIANMNLSMERIQSILKLLRKNRKDLEDELNESINLSYSAEVIAKYISIFTKELGVWDVYRNDEKGLFTDDLKSKSGSNLHLIVLAFRMAYASSVNSMCRTKLPLIIDSVRGRELSNNNFKKSMAFLSKEMEGYQRILVSISDSHINADECIVIEGHLMKGAMLIDDLGEWEADD